MTFASRALYEKVLLDHAKNPRNYGKPDTYDRKIEGYNPLCGDRFTFYLKYNGDIIEKIYFTGQGCAISKASASLLTAFLEKQPIEKAVESITKFIELLKTSPDKPVNEEEWGKLTVLAGVREFPIRIKCASLAWHSLLNVLNGTEKVTTTE